MLRAVFSSMLARMPGGSGDFQSGRFTQDDIFRELEQIFQGSGCYELPCGAVISLEKDQPEAARCPWYIPPIRQDKPGRCGCLPAITMLAPPLLNQPINIMIP